MNDYLESLRDVERRIQKAEEQSAKEGPDVDQPAGVPDGFEPHVQLLYDLQLLAYQSDLTRVITFMYGREQTGRPYPQIGIPEPHHSLTHHQNDPAKMEKCATIQTYHVKLFAEYLEKLRATPDGDGSLLDHVILLYGSGISNSDRHTHGPLPTLLLGGGAGTLKGGRHLVYPDDTPLTNLQLTLLNKMGVPAEKLGDSTGQFKELSELSATSANPSAPSDRIARIRGAPQLLSQCRWEIHSVRKGRERQRREPCERRVASDRREPGAQGQNPRQVADLPHATDVS